MCLRNSRKIGGDDVSKQPMLFWKLRSKRHTTGGEGVKFGGVGL